MPVELERRRFAGSLAERLRTPPDAAEVFVYWLGQAGFLVRTARLTMLIDPYLSDSLADKYRHRPSLSHERMMPAPIAVDRLVPVDLVLCTHHHTDHMDAATLAPLAASLPRLRIVVPRASAAEAMRRIGVAADRLIGADAGDDLVLAEDVRIRPTRAAHETLERDADGCHRFLGYGITLGGVTLFHSGDTIPFDGQPEEVAALAPDVALLPVNGRRAALARQGIAGNFFLQEALALARQCGIPTMLAHHYGMFAFNTVSRDVIQTQAEPALLGVEYRLQPRAL